MFNLEFKIELREAMIEPKCQVPSTIIFIPRIIFACPRYFLGTISSITAKIAEYSPPTANPVKNLHPANLKI